MTIKKIQKKLETLEKWELINFWRTLPQEDMWEIAKLFKKYPELNAKITYAGIRSCQFRIGDTVFFPKDESNPSIPAGTTGKVTALRYGTVKRKPYLSEISIGLLINGAGYILTRTMHSGDKYPNSLNVYSINGDWEAL